MSDDRVQCLLFIVDTKPSGVRKSRRGQAHSSIKGYAILPQAFIDTNPYIFDSFLHNDFQVLVNSQANTTLKSSLENTKLEMFETQILLEDPEDELSTINSSRPHCMLVDPFNREVIELLLSRNFQILTLNEDENTGFTSAVTNNLNALEFLSTADANITYNHYKGGTILHFAVKRSDVSLVKLLLKCGANINAVRNDGFTPLHKAAQKGNLEIVKVLVQSGADVNSSVEHADQEGWTPLVIAYMSNKRFSGEEDEKNILKVMRFLLESGANVDNEFSCNQSYIIHDFSAVISRSTILYLAALDGNHSEEENLLDIILNHNPNIDNEHNKKAFHYILCTIKDKFIDPFNKMLQIGFRVNLEEVGDYLNFLCGAIHKNYSELVKSIVRKGTRVTEMCQCRYTSLGKFTPLHVAAGYADEDIFNFLLAHGADINAKSTTMYGEHETPLQWAVRYDNRSSIRILMNHKASFLNEMDDLFRSAAQNDLLDIIEFFLLNGENLNYGAAIYTAAAFGHIEVVKTLLKYGIEFGTEPFSSSTLVAAYNNGHTEVFQTLLNLAFGKRAVLFGLHDNSLVDICKKPTEDDDLYVEKLNCLTILARHIIKMEAEHFLIFEQDLAPIWNTRESIDDFRSHCESEIARMKTEAVNESGLTFHHILIGNLNQLIGYLRNKTNVNNISQADYTTMFPIYADVISCQFEKGNLRVRLMKEGIEIYKKLFQTFKTLPDELKEKIISYLDTRDLKRLSIAWSHRESHQETETWPPSVSANDTAL